MDAPAKQSPVLLIATEGEWAGRSLESVLERHGYAILRAEDGREALGRVLHRQPDAMILDEHLAGMGGIEVCELLREDPSFDSSTPIIITASAPAPRAVRAAAYRAGAWEFCTQPLDIDTLLLQLGTFLRAKREVAKQRNRALVDRATGLLTPEGLERWAEKLAARASRNHEPLACVVLDSVAATHVHSDSTSDHQGDSSSDVSDFMQLSRESFRRSDIVGRTSDGRLALLAPETDAQGVRGMLARLRAAIGSPAAHPGQHGADFKAGYWAVQDFASAPLEAPELMRRAMRAHDHLKSTHNKFAIGFDQLPVS
jgi:two-component system cell cycle response regulator